MVLVDTSVMIDYLNGSGKPAVEMFQYILDNEVPFGINSFIYQEVLQGVRTEKTFFEVKKYLDTQRFYHLKDPIGSFAEAAMIYFRCRKRGITINSTLDCLIARTAIENNLFLLHNDSDFDKMAGVVPLKIFRLQEG